MKTKKSPLLPSTPADLMDLLRDAYEAINVFPTLLHVEGGVRWVYGTGVRDGLAYDRGVTFTRLVEVWEYRFDDGEVDFIATEAHLVRDVLVRPNSAGLADPDPTRIAELHEAAVRGSRLLESYVLREALDGRAGALLVVAATLRRDGFLV